MREVLGLYFHRILININGLWHDFCTYLIAEIFNNGNQKI